MNNGSSITEEMVAKKQRKNEKNDIDIIWYHLKLVSLKRKLRKIKNIYCERYEEKTLKYEQNCYKNFSVNNWTKKKKI